jgi:hypothetical protein
MSGSVIIGTVKAKCHHVLFALMAVLFLSLSAGTQSAIACQSKDKSSSCCAELEQVTKHHDCCSAQTNDCQSVDNCSCGNPVQDAIPTASYQTLIPAQTLGPPVKVTFTWQTSNNLTSSLHYKPPKLRKPRDKIYLLTHSLLI